MTLETIALISAAGFVVLSGASVFLIKRPKKLKTDRFIASWRELQGLCKNRETWAQAIIQADKLLDAALKKRKLKGKTMGARMVSAQRLFTDNDDTWFAHNLAKKLKGESAPKLKESDVKSALIGFRQALKDIGAFPDHNEQANKKS